MCAVNAAGEDVYAKVTRGVVLATGNFVANKELMHNFMRPREVENVQLSSSYDEGDALLMGLEIGAATHSLNSFTFELTDVALKKASEEAGVGFDVGATCSCSDSPIYVNQKAHRFMNEGQTLDHFKGTRPWLEYSGIAASGYTGWTNLPCYMVFDSKLADSSPISTTSSYRMSWAGTQGLHYGSSDNQDEVDREWLVKADTLEKPVAVLAKQGGRECPVRLWGQRNLTHPIPSPKHLLRAPRKFPRRSAVLSPVQPQLHPSQLRHLRGRDALEHRLGEVGHHGGPYAGLDHGGAHQGRPAVVDRTARAAVQDLHLGVAHLGRAATIFQEDQ